MGKRNGLNYTNGGFDIKKQAALSANAAIDAVIDSGALHSKHMDKATHIAATMWCGKKLHVFFF